MRIRVLTVFMLAMATSSSAHATFSVLAVESATGRIGGAAVSCVGDFSVTVIYGAAPGRGAIHAQAELSRTTRLEAIELLSAGMPPDEIIKRISDPAFDPNASVRQYGIVDFEGRVAGFTGVDTGPYAAHRQGEVDGIRYSVQGNILTSGVVLDQMQVAMNEGCDLTDRLVRAVEAGGANGEGDSRCTPDGISADSGFLRVETRDGARLIDLDVVDTAPTEPLMLLRQGYDQWREGHPCPEPSSGGDADGAAHRSKAPEPSTDAPTGCDGCSTPQSAPKQLAWMSLLIPLGALAWRRRRHKPRSGAVPCS